MEEKNLSTAAPEEETQEKEGISRRSFVRGMAMSAAGLALAGIIPGGIMTAAATDNNQPFGQIKKISQTVKVNGKSVSFEAYTINGACFVDLSDIAYTLSGTPKKFSVDVDSSGRRIKLTSGGKYTKDGKEMKTRGDKSSSASLANMTVIVDGKEVSLSPCLIGGRFYIKLLELGSILNFYVSYDSSKKTIIINTSKSFYVEGDGIFINDDLSANYDGGELTLEFVDPVFLRAYLKGVDVTLAGTWNSSDKHFVYVTETGAMVMRDGLGGNDVTVTFTLLSTTYTLTVHTSASAGAHPMNVEIPLVRGAFVKKLSEYFGWYHYNNYMDDGIDIDDDGNVKHKVRNYLDVNVDSDYAEDIEMACDAEVLTPASSSERFYPFNTLTREYAAVLLCRAFKIDPVSTNVISGFDDYGTIATDEGRAALNALFAKGYMRGRTFSTIDPAAGITDTEADLYMQNIARRVVSPVWIIPREKRTFVRFYPDFITSTEGARIFYKFHTFNETDPSLARDSKLNGAGFSFGGIPSAVLPEAQQKEWLEYIPGWSSCPTFSMSQCMVNPSEEVSVCYQLECYATKDGMEDSPHTFYTYKLRRDPWPEFSIDKLHDKGDGFPMVYRFYDSFQAAAYYIEGSESGVLWDGLMPTNTEAYGYANLMEKVNTIATKPWIFVCGHEHVDHYGCMGDCYRGGIDVYASSICAASVYSKLEIPLEDIKILKEGDSLSLGDVQLEVYHLPGHANGNLILYNRANGLIFSSDIYSVNRYWLADGTGVSGVKADLLLSLQQQLMDKYRAGGSVIKEVYTGHNRLGTSGDYLIAWEQCLQQMVDFGTLYLSNAIRGGDGKVQTMWGDRYRTLNWTSFQYSGTLNAETYKAEQDAITKNLQYPDIAANAHLSNICFKDATLVGHDFEFNTGNFIANKFVPADTAYEVKVPALQTSVTFVPTAMSNLAKSITVNGNAVSSRCPVTVSTSSPAVVTVTAPNGTDTMTYTFSFSASA